MNIGKRLFVLLLGVIGLSLISITPVFAGTLTDFSHTADTWQPGAIATHTFTFTTATDIPSGGLISIQTSGFDMHYYYTATITVNGGPNILNSYSGNGYLGANTFIAAGSTIVVTTKNPNAGGGTYSLTFGTEDSSHNPIDTVAAPSFTILTLHGGYSPPLPEPVQTEPEAKPVVVAPAVPKIHEPEPEKFVEPVDNGTNTMRSMASEAKSTTTLVLSNQPKSPYINSYIKLGAKNDKEDVKKLKKFLNLFEKTNLSEDGIYTQKDVEAVKQFQAKYAEKILHPWNITQPTGYVYQTTRDFINQVWDAYRARFPSNT